MSHLPALVTLLTVLLLAANVYVVGRARGRYGIKAPAVSGHPAFERAYRVQTRARHMQSRPPRRRARLLISAANTA